VNLLYKPDWDDTKKRYEAWWAHELLDRCAISVVSPRTDALSLVPPALPDKLEDRWLDFEYISALNDYQLSRLFFGGESLPVWCPGWPGWGSIPCFLGATITLKEETGWIDPIISDGALTDYDYNSFIISPENRWWKLHLDILRHATREALGKSIVPVGAFGGSGDTLAGIRGSDKLLFDVIDSPEYVREFDLYLMKQWIEVHDTSYRIAREATEGSTCWFNLWSPGRFYAAQNDFSYMISPEMFIDIFLPAIEMQTNYLDHSVYHVDGIGAFVHVDALSELPKLQAFQILPGTGKPSPLHYMDILKKLQAKGKNLHLSILPGEVEYALSQLSSKGLFLEVWCETEEEAKALLVDVQKWTRD
jgi:hypothetical protein